MYVVKLGGSLYNTSQLRAWLSRLADVSAQQPMVIVPGGGPFADQVRDAQQLHGFSDSHAHQMALLAMAQFGTLISALLPTGHVVTKPEAVLDSKLTIWVPDRHMMQVDQLTHSWDVTSDSLALWLAQQIQAQQLVLVKRKLIESSTMKDWQQQGIIDAAFLRLYDRQPLPIMVTDWNDAELFPRCGLELG